MKKLASLISAFGILTAASCISCLPPTTHQDKPKDDKLYDVNWVSLVSDEQVAEAFIGHRVRLRFSKKDYVRNNTSLHVWANIRLVPPVIICRCISIPDETGDVVVVGICSSITHDGIWRSPRSDYSVTIEDCVVTVQSP